MRYEDSKLKKKNTGSHSCHVGFGGLLTGEFNVNDKYRWVQGMSVLRTHTSSMGYSPNYGPLLVIDHITGLPRWDPNLGNYPYSAHCAGMCCDYWSQINARKQE